jgi:hypothetical protein
MSTTLNHLNPWFNEEIPFPSIIMMKGSLKYAILVVTHFLVFNFGRSSSYFDCFSREHEAFSTDPPAMLLLLLKQQSQKTRRNLLVLILM